MESFEEKIMKHFSIAVFSLAALFAACDDSSSAPADDPIAQSSSSEPFLSSSNETETTSSSSTKQVIAVSSSSERKSNGGEISSSSKTEKQPESSSNQDILSSSEKAVEFSSSSEQPALLSSSGKNEESSSSIASSSSVNGFDWSIPKENYLNPAIKYDSIKDSRDGKVYKTVKIGEQIWMAENLNYSDSAKTPSLKGSMWCHGDEPKNCDVGGAFYTWGAAIDSIALYNDGKGVICGYDKKCNLTAKVQGICPDGWHLPDTTEWRALFKEVGNNSTEGTVLKSQKGWNIIKASSSNGNGTDIYGFSAFPVGLIERDAKYHEHTPRYNGMLAYFWTATEGSAKTAQTAEFENANRFARLHYTAKDMGISVRCIKDANKQ